MPSPNWFSASVVYIRLWLDPIHFTLYIVKAWYSATIAVVSLMFCLAIFALLILSVGATPSRKRQTEEKAISAVSDQPNAAASCFPALDFEMPSQTPSDNDLASWWCKEEDEYAFLGFSYAVWNCQSRSTLIREFKDIRNRFNGRYVRLYGNCDRTGFYDDIVEAAWQAGIGVHALIWFGFDGDDQWKGRRDRLLGTLHSNRRAKFVTRALQFGSEPLFDWVLSVTDLTNEIKKAQTSLSSVGIPVTISEMVYGYQSHEFENSQRILDTIDLIDAHVLPFFSWDATIANNSWPSVEKDFLNYYLERGGGKKIYFSQNGWPSVSYPGVEPNSPDAVADIQNEKDYSILLDNRCEWLKRTGPRGGIGWFWHLYSDSQAPGYGLYNTNGNLKFSFSPRTHC